MLIIRNNQVDKNKWCHLLKDNPYASPFQTYEYYEYFNSIDGLSADVFAIEENGEYIALSIVTIRKESGVKGIFSRRGIIYGGPLLADNNNTVFSFLLNNLVEHYKSKLIYIEIRNYFDYSKIFRLSINNNWEFLPYLNFRIALKNRDLEEVLSSMKYNRRREIRLSLERDAMYKECETEQELVQLYNILVDLYKTRVQLPLPQFCYFEALWKSDIGKVFLVTHNNQVIGGSFCTFLKKHSIYTMYYCGIRDYDKQIFPTHLAVLAAIDYAIKNEMQYLDFMGAGLKGEEYGVRKYKKGFGGELNEYGRYRNILRPTLFYIGVKGLDIMKRIIL